MKFPWLADNVKQFIPLVREQRVPHALLLSARKGMGKFELANQMAQIAMCENTTDNGACFKCSACVLLKAGNHTDLSVIKAENAVIKVGQIRKLTSGVVLTSSKNQYKVIIINEAEKMNVSSANALLKTLEEPPQKVLIILTTSEIGRLLPTIKSRCVKVGLRPAPPGLMKQWLCSQINVSNEDVDFAQLLSNDSPLLALSMLQDNTLLDVRQMLKDLEGIKKQNSVLLDVSKKWFSNNWHLNLNFIAVILLNKIAQMQQLKINKNEIINLSIAIDESELLSFVKKIFAFNKRLDTPIKLELQLEKLLLLWKKE